MRKPALSLGGRLDPDRTYIPDADCDRAVLDLELLVRTRSRQPRHNGVRKGRQPQIMATSISSIVQIDSRALEAVLPVRSPEEFDREVNKMLRILTGQVCG